MVSAVASADNTSQYIFAMHLNFDPTLDPVVIEDDPKAMRLGIDERSVHVQQALDTHLVTIRFTRFVICAAHGAVGRCGRLAQSAALTSLQFCLVESGRAVIHQWQLRVIGVDWQRLKMRPMDHFQV